MVASSKGLFNDTATIGAQYKTGMVKTVYGVDFRVSQNTPTHTIGSLSATEVTIEGLLSSGSSSNVDTAITKGWASGDTLNEGDIISFEEVFAVNAITKLPINAGSTKYKNFTVTKSAVADATGKMSIAFSPSIIDDGTLQNVDVSPAVDDVVYFYGVTNNAKAKYGNKTCTVNLVYVKQAFTIASVELELPKGFDMAFRTSSKNSWNSYKIFKRFRFTYSRIY